MGESSGEHALIEIEQLRFRYPRSEFQLRIDRLSIQSGEKIAFVGPSGSGKTTLLNLVAGISIPEQGQVRVLSEAVHQLSDARRRLFRITNIGFVFQQFELIDYLSALDNILLPFWVNDSLSMKYSDRERTTALAKDMGIGDKLNRHPRQLSQGEQQRVAICRALVNQPKLILADEPTGNLDPANKQTILKILLDRADQHGQTLIVVTHDMGILKNFDRVIDVADLQSSILQSATAGESESV